MCPPMKTRHQRRREVETSPAPWLMGVTCRVLSMPSPPHEVEVTSLRWPEPAAREKGVGSSSQSEARPIREDQRVTRSHKGPCGPGTSEGRRHPPRRDDPPRLLVEYEPLPRHLFDGSDYPDAGSLKRHSSRVRSMMSAPHRARHRGQIRALPLDTFSLWSSGVAGLQMRMFPLPPAGTWGRPWKRWMSGGQSPSRQGSAAATLELAGWSGPAPESAECRGSASQSVGAKRSAPEQGSSDRPVK
jgi:hypothetical protein